MCWLRKGSHETSVVLLLAIVCVVGCSTLPSSMPSSGIDPSGDSVFLGSSPCSNLFASSNASSNSTYTPPYSPYTYTVPGSSYTTSGNKPPQLGKTSGAKVLPQPLLGESYDKYPDTRLQWDNTGLVVTPGRIVAPVGSQVILKAGVIAPDHYLSMNEEVQWTMTSGSVGQFVEVDPGSLKDLCFGDFTFPRKISPLQAVTSTSRNNLNLTRGTPVTSDDVKIHRGETWVTVSSPVEGASFVTVRAPSVYDWNAREKTALIHWIDAQWEFPAPSFAPAGSRQVLKTKLSRQSDRQPLVGWRVRYTIAGGPPAGFTPSGANSVEAISDVNGEAIVEIAENQAVSGTNQITIEVVRPDGGAPLGAGGLAAGAITVEHGSTMVTWSAADLSVTMAGPQTATVGATMTYQIRVTNPGDLPTEDVQVVNQLPYGANHIDSNPPPSQDMGTSLKWDIARLNPGETRIIQVNLRANQEGTMESSVEATAAGGLTTRGSATTNVGSPKLDVQVYCMTRDVRVGDIVLFHINVKNLGQVAATDVKINDVFDEGLYPIDVPDARTLREINSKGKIAIPVGQTSVYYLKFRADRQGRLCHTVTVTDSGQKEVTAQGCVDVAPAVATDSGTGTPPIPMGPATSGTPGDEGYTPPARRFQPGVSITKTKIGPPKQATIGEKIQYKIEVKNTGQAELTNLTIMDYYDPQLFPTQVSPGCKDGPELNQFHWKLDSLPPGEKKEYGVEYEVRAPAGVARNRAEVTTAEEVRDTSEVSITVVKPASTDTGPPTGDTGATPPSTSGAAIGGVKKGNLVLSIFDNGEGFPIESPYDYTINVKNLGAAPDRNVLLTFYLSPGLKLKKAGTIGIRTKSGHTPTIDKISGDSTSGQTVTFKAVPEVMSGEKVTYNVRVEPTVPGTEQIQAFISSDSVPSLQNSEMTTITPRR